MRLLLLLPILILFDFNPRTPCGVRLDFLRRRTHLNHFNPRTPCGVRPATVTTAVTKYGKISIHAPLAGCDCGQLPQEPNGNISIHAPLAGCDPAESHSLFSSNRFQSTHPLRGATQRKRKQKEQKQISIHAPLAGCDLAWHVLLWRF